VSFAQITGNRRDHNRAITTIWLDVGTVRDYLSSETNRMEKDHMKHDNRSGPLDSSALHLLHRAGQCAEVLFTNEASKSDLTPRQFAVLVCVAQNPDVSQTGLVEQTGVDRSTLADVVRRLVKKGLLHRKRTRRDARMYAVRLTPKGQNILGGVKPLASKVDQRILSVLRPDQRGGFIESLGEIVRAMTRTAVPG
jgi:DNA-binding MarR family transcriptional regulator